MTLDVHYLRSNITKLGIQYLISNVGIHSITHM